MARIVYVASNPDGTDPVAYTTTKIERAPDAAGTPGTFALIATISIDTSNENTDYLDPTGTTTSWYRHYWTDGGAAISDYSPAIQAGDSLIRQWIRADVVDTDILSTDWDRWIDQTFQDLNLANVGRPADIQTITVTGFDTEWYPINAALRFVTRVDIYYGTKWITDTDQWEQRGRQIRLFRPVPIYTYKVYGQAEIRCMADLDDELFMLLYWGVRTKYFDVRLAQRSRFRKFLSSSKGEEIHTGQLLQLKQDAQQEWAMRLASAYKANTIPARSL